MSNVVVGHLEKVRAIAAQARLFAVGGVRAGAGSAVHVVDHVSGKPQLSIDLPSHVRALVWAGEKLVVGCVDGTVRVIDVTSGSFVRVWRAGDAAVTALALGPDNDRLLSAGADGALRLWSLHDGSSRAAWTLSARPLYAAAFDPTGEYGAGAGEDGVVRSVTLVNGAVREMPGHDGPVFALAFTPRDGRLASGGDDGTVRLWYLVGDVESEVRGQDDTAHVGGVGALIAGPAATVAKDGTDPGDRLYSAGADGKVRAWRLGDRRKPRTIDMGGQLTALAYVRGAGRGAASLLVGGEARSLSRYALDATGTPASEGASTVYVNGFADMRAATGAAQPRREAVVAALAPLDEPEAIDLLVQFLKADRDAGLRATAATLLGEHARRSARGALRERLDDDQPRVRDAALEALRALDVEAPLSPAQAALGSRHADVRVRGLTLLAALRDSSPLVPGLIAQRLVDADARVRAAALEALVSLYPAGAPEPLQTAFARGPADVRAEVVTRASLAGLTRAPGVASLVARALDDDDADVRRVAFTVTVLERRALASALRARDPEVERDALEVGRRGVRARRGQGGQGNQGGQGDKTAEPTEAEVGTLLASVPGSGRAGDPLDEADLTPLLSAMACRTAETALRGARGLAKFGDTRALGALLQLSREPEARLRREAAAALQDLNDPRAKKRLVWMFDDADAAVRSTALGAFAALEGEASPVLAEAALRSSQEDVRVRGLDLLVKGGLKKQVTPETDGLLGEALEDESPKVRGEAFRTLWLRHENEKQRAVDRALAGRFADVRARAVGELQAIVAEPWAFERLAASVGDRDADVAQRAYDAVVKHKGKADPEAHLAAMASVHASVRVAGAKGAKHAAREAVRGALVKLLEDGDALVRLTAVETLDAVFANEAAPLYVALQVSQLDVRVRAAELLAHRHDERIIDAMRALLGDKTLERQVPAPALAALRRGAAGALAALGSPRNVKYFANELVKDDASEVREQAARGLANSARRGDEGYLLDALGHGEVAVRSWAADGLSRLGDARALPVLTGNLRHEHLPIRLGAILSFAALGPEGYGGLLQGLEDASKEVQDLVFALVLARDLRAFRAGEAPDLLTSALSSQRPDVRFAAARALELRTDPALYTAHLVEALAPARPEKASDAKGWPEGEARDRLLVGLAEALAGDRPDLRYAAAQALLLRRKPLDFFREAARVAKPHAVGKPVVPDTTPRPQGEGDTAKARGWLRHLFAEGVAGKAPSVEVDDARFRLRWLAFGAYVGLLRQVGDDDEGHRVRRDAIDRIVEQTNAGVVAKSASLPALIRSLDDPHHLVRKAAFAGLKKLYDVGSDEPLTLALASRSGDVARAALDELATRGEDATPRLVAALNAPLAEVRKYGYELLEKRAPRGSLEPLLAALASDYADVRVGVIERLTTTDDGRVVEALTRALRSDHDDLRLRAAELLARRRDPRAVDVLAAFLRGDHAGEATRATDALVRIGDETALRALVTRLDELTDATARASLVTEIGKVRSGGAVDALTARFGDESEAVRRAAFAAAVGAAGKKKERDGAALARLLAAAASARAPELRREAAPRLGKRSAGADADAILGALFSDRDAATRRAAVASYARRVVKLGSAVEPLDNVLRAGARDLMLAAAEGVAARKGGAALRPLLLFARAGEGGERERALVALGTLGDARALDELVTVAEGGTKEAPVEPSMRAAAVEGLGRLTPFLAAAEARARARAIVERALGDRADAMRVAAVRALRFIGGEGARAKLEGVLLDGGAPSTARERAAKELGKLADADAEHALDLALRDNDLVVRSAARAALTKLFPGERTRVEFLALASPHDDVAGPAASYLADHGDAALLLPRLAKLDDDDLRERLRFGLLRRPEVPSDALAELLGDASPATREAAAWLIAARAPKHNAGADASPFAAALAACERATAAKWAAAHEPLRGEEARAWQAVMHAAVVTGAASWVGRLREVASEVAAPIGVRVASLDGLANAGKGSDGPALAKLLLDGDVRVRAAAASALGALAPLTAASLALAVEPFDAVAFGHAAAAGVPDAVWESSKGRRLALPAALPKGSPPALRALAERSGDEGGRVDALAALGRAADEPARALLRAIASDKDGASEVVRKAAYRALRRAQRATEKAKKYGAATR